MGTEVIYAVVAIATVIGLMLLVRRASARQIESGAAGVQKRLRGRGEDDADREPTAVEKERKAKEQRRAERKKRLAEQREKRLGDAEERRKKVKEREEEAEEEEEEETEAETEAQTEAEAETEPEPEPEPEEKKKELTAGLAKTRGGFVAKLGKLFARKSIDKEVLEELESVLFTADIGPKTAEKLFGMIKKELGRDQMADADAIWSRIREESATILAVNSPPVDIARARPFVILTIGVNGVGKTTTIGKLAAKLTRQGKKVLLAAGDTFRAAATEQLEIWAKRAGAELVKGKSGADPASVIFDAVKKGADEGYDVVIADTAGRLQTKVDLMEELKKVRRVVDKAVPGAPHETWMVLDATTGQNAIQQAQVFKQAMDITGIVLTKLDGTAKGGVILGICDELAVPVRYIGIGEQIDDLREFDARAFVDALYSEAEAA
jgi:fused signal recognition particle receptor